MIKNEPLPASADPQGDTIEGQVRDGVRSAVSRLPHNLRSVVVPYYLQGMSVAEIAESLDISEENIKSRLHRARKKPRVFFEEHATIMK